MKGLLLFSVVISTLLILILSGPALAIVGPKAYVNEYVTCDYNYDGTVATAAARTGYVQVSVPNDDDVLQYVNVTLQNFNPNTTLTGSAGVANRNVVTSYPTVNSTTNIYVDTSAGSRQSNYVINSTDAAPTINLSLTWTNEKGGTDLYDADNLYYTSNNITFNLTIRNPSGTDDLSNVNVTIYFGRNVNGTSDAIDVHTLVSSKDRGGSTVGTMDSWDLDSDGDTDTVNWIGNMGHDADNDAVKLARLLLQEMKSL